MEVWFPWRIRANDKLTLSQVNPRVWSFFSSSKSNLIQSFYISITIKLSMQRSSIILTAIRFVFLKDRLIVPLNALIFSTSISAFRYFCKPAPSVFWACHGEENLIWGKTSVVIISIEYAHSDILFCPSSPHFRFSGYSSQGQVYTLTQPLVPWDSFKT